MDLQAIPSRPPITLWTLLRFVHDRNPFYLLSAVSMFVGYRIVIAALDSAPGEVRPLLSLIVTMNVYEVALIALALYLVVGRGLRRDGWILLGLESLFLVDLTNLNAELFTAWPRVGAAVNAACFALAVAKIAVILRALRLRVTPATAAYGVAQLAALFALPGLFRLLRSDTAAVSAADVYGVWWLVGGLLAAGGVVVRRDGRTHGNAMAALPGRLFVVVPLASLVLHLVSQNRVYWVHFEPANVAPVLLAAAVAVQRDRLDPVRLRWVLGLIAAAVVVSFVPTDEPASLTGHLLGAAVTPVRLAVVGSAVTLAVVAWHHRSPLAAAVLVAGVVAPALPPLARQVGRAVEWAWDTTLSLIPSTPLQWGCAAIVAAFALLGVGAAVSLRAAAPPAGGATS